MSQNSWERAMFTTTLHHLFPFFSLQHSVSIWGQFLQFRKQNAFLLLLQKGFQLYTISHFITHQMFSVSDRSELQPGQFSKARKFFYFFKHIFTSKARVKHREVQWFEKHKHKASWFLERTKTCASHLAIMVLSQIYKLPIACASFKVFLSQVLCSLTVLVRGVPEHF